MNNYFKPRQLNLDVSNDPSPKPELSNRSQNNKRKNVALPSRLSSVIRSSNGIGKNPNLRKQSKFKKEITEVEINKVYSKLDKLIAEEERKAQEIESQRNGRPLKVFEVFGKKKREPDSDSNSDSYFDSDSDKLGKEIYQDSDSVKLSEDPETDSDDESQRQCWENEIIKIYD